jgi:hypothetical protein
MLATAAPGCADRCGKLSKGSNYSSSRQVQLSSRPGKETKKAFLIGPPAHKVTQKERKHQTAATQNAVSEKVKDILH